MPKKTSFLDHIITFVILGLIATFCLLLFQNVLVISEANKWLPFLLVVVGLFALPQGKNNGYGVGLFLIGTGAILTLRSLGYINEVIAKDSLIGFGITLIVILIVLFIIREIRVDR